MNVPDIIDIKIAAKEKKLFFFVKGNYIYVRNDIGECVKICELSGEREEKNPGCFAGDTVWAILFSQKMHDFVIEEGKVKEIDSGSFENPNSDKAEKHIIHVMGNKVDRMYFGSAFGKELFATREEAEIGLKEKREQIEKRVREENNIQ